MLRGGTGCRRNSSALLRRSNPVIRPGASVIEDTLLAVLRAGARRVRQAPEAEVEAVIAAYSDLVAVLGVLSGSK